MSENQKQILIDINNIVLSLDEKSQETIKRIAIRLLDIKLMGVMPKLEENELNEMDVTEKLMLLQEYSLSDEERKKENEEVIPLEDILKEEGLL